MAQTPGSGRLRASRKQVGFGRDRRRRTLKNPVALFRDLARWLPFVLIGPVVFALRVPGLARWAASWVWIPVAVVLAVQLARRHQELVFSREAALLGGFVAWAALSLVWSPDPVRGLRFVLLVAVAYLAYLWVTVVGPPRWKVSTVVGRLGRIGIGAGRSDPR